MNVPRRQRKVVSLRGAAIPLPQVNRDVVKACEMLLAEAKAGNIAGLLWARIAPQGHIKADWCGNADSHGMMAAAGMLSHRVFAAWLR